MKKKTILSRILAYALIASVLSTSIVATPVSAEKTRDMSIDELVLSDEPILEDEYLLSDESMYVKSVAETLLKPVGLIDYDDVPDDEELHVFIWLQELPTALEKIYREEGMSVDEFSTAQTNAQIAREQIRNLGGQGETLERDSTSVRNKTAPTLTITFEYFTVFAGFAIKAKKSVVEQIGEMPGVYMVTQVGYYELHSTTYKPDPDYNTPGNVAAREAWEIGALHARGIDGTGVKVGVIDSGIQTDHPDIVDSYIRGWNFTNCQGGNSGDMSFPDEDHGIHVAGTIASQGETSLGIAPGADVYMAQVFGVSAIKDDPNDNSGASDVVLAALESFSTGESYTYTQDGRIYTPNLPKVDVVNMSLGVSLRDHTSTSNTAFSASQYARNNAVLAGVVVVVSGGNAAYYDGGNPLYQGTRNPYTLTSGSASLQISVAASMYGGNPVYRYEPLVSSSGSSGASEINMRVENGDRLLSGVFKRDGFSNDKLNFTDEGYEAYVCMTGVPSASRAVTTAEALAAIPTGSLNGKILVVGRGLTFSVYKDEALRTSAGGLIVVNRESAFIGMDISSTPSKDLAIFTTAVESAAALLTTNSAGEIYLMPGDRVDDVPPKEPTTFSSIGPVRETAEIKPDVIAPGYAILSTSLDNDYSVMSGTSMASPAVAGVVALILQANPNITPTEVKARLMNTAEPFLLSPNTTNNKLYEGSPHYFKQNGTEVSVYEQGAGFVNPTRAVDEDVYITVENIVPTNHTNMGTQTAHMGSFSFGNNPPGSVSKKLTASVHGGGTIQSVRVIERNDTRFSRAHAGMVSVKTDVRAGAFDVWLEINENASADVEDGNLYEGYIEVTIDGKVYHLPYATRIQKFSILGIAERPIISTSQDPKTRSASGDDPRNSSATTVYFTWNGEIPDNPRTDNEKRIRFFLIDAETDKLAYYYGGTVPSNPINNNTRWSLIPNLITDTARPIIDGSIRNTRETIKNGAYYFAIEAGETYFYDEHLGVVFTDGLGDMAVELTIDKLDENERVPVVDNEKVTTTKITGRIFSPALELAAKHDFWWTEFGDFREGIAYEINQSFNVLAYASENDIYAMPATPLTGFILNEDDELWYCDKDGYFSLTLNVTQAQKDGGYLFTAPDNNNSIVGVEGFYLNNNNTSRPYIGANKSPAITPRYKMRKLIGDANRDGKIDVADITYLKRVLVKNVGFPENDECDVNSDGKVDAADLTYLKGYITKRPGFVLDEQLTDN